MILSHTHNGAKLLIMFYWFDLHNLHNTIALVVSIEYLCYRHIREFLKIRSTKQMRRCKARISHQIDEPSLALCFHKKFYSVGQISRIADLHG